VPSARSEEAGRAALEALRELHGEIDREAARLADRHAGRLRCGRGCSACCLDDLRVSAVEAERIREGHPELLETGVPGPIGACAFLDADGACRIYADRPLVCRTQGLPLRVFREDEQDEVVEQRDICPLNLEGGPALDALDESDCWLVGPHELRLMAIDEEFAGSEAPRIPLRSLFARDAR
jgi:Fe-S-cluster containining protein